MNLTDNITVEKLIELLDSAKTNAMRLSTPYDGATRDQIRLGCEVLIDTIKGEITNP